MTAGPVLLADPPLDPSGDEARRLLVRELVHPDYQDVDLVERIVRWVERWVARSVDAASSAPPVAVAAAILVAVLVLVALILLGSRARKTARSERAGTAPALLDGAVSAAEWRRRAEDALASGDASTALVDGFRAAAVRQVESGRIEDVPQATARELAVALGAAFPDRAAELRAGAALFDEVLYGDHVATAEQARTLLALDDALAGRRAGALR